MLSGNCSMVPDSVRVFRTYQPDVTSCWHEPSKQEMNIMKHQPVFEISEHLHSHNMKQTTPRT